MDFEFWENGDGSSACFALRMLSHFGVLSAANSFGLFPRFRVGIICTVKIPRGVVRQSAVGV